MIPTIAFTMRATKIAGKYVLLQSDFSHGTSYSDTMRTA